jgi:hypothetical protein
MALLAALPEPAGCGGSQPTIRIHGTVTVCRSGLFTLPRLRLPGATAEAHCR